MGLIIAWYIQTLDPFLRYIVGPSGVNDGARYSVFLRHLFTSFMNGHSRISYHYA